VVRGHVVVMREAKSQKRSGERMDKEEFQASKDAILGWVSNLLGVEPGELEKAHAA
jgi:hypothetical protein